jgi:FkbM family methyltransferase
MIHKVCLKSRDVSVELDGDYYGSEFWEKISSRRYEPDTIGFLEDRCDNQTDFMDIGAANGAMTLIAANVGSRVSSYEPEPRIYRVVSQNVMLNPVLGQQILVQNKAISVDNGILQFKKDRDSSVLSPIVFTGHDATNSVNIDVLSLSDEIEKFHVDKSRKLIIKMDIEGAEWRILKSRKILSALGANEATLLLAVHPGFYRPFVPKLRGLDKFLLGVWKLRNYQESVETFKLLSKFASIQRTNLNPIDNKRQFASLISAGYHEFIVEFQST